MFSFFFLEKKGGVETCLNRVPVPALSNIPSATPHESINTAWVGQLGCGCGVVAWILKRLCDTRKELERWLGEEGVRDCRHADVGHRRDVWDARRERELNAAVARQSTLTIRELACRLGNRTRGSSCRRTHPLSRGYIAVGDERSAG